MSDLAGPGAMPAGFPALSDGGLSVYVSMSAREREIRTGKSKEREENVCVLRSYVVVRL